MTCVFDLPSEECLLMTARITSMHGCKNSLPLQQYLLTFFTKKKKPEETQLMHVTRAEGASVSIYFRFLA